MFAQFWKLGDYSKQNILLSKCLKLRDPEKICRNNRKQKLVIWMYLFMTNETIH